DVYLEKENTMPHLPPGSVSGGSVTVWLPCTQQGANGKRLRRLFNVKPTGQQKNTGSTASRARIDLASNNYKLDDHYIYLIEVFDGNGAKPRRIVPSRGCRINFYFATEAEMEDAGIPRDGKVRKSKILALNKAKWALKARK